MATESPVKDGEKANVGNISQSTAAYVAAPFVVWAPFIVVGITLTIFGLLGELSLAPGIEGAYLLLSLLIALYGTGIGLATFLRIAFIADVIALALAIAALIVR